MDLLRRVRGWSQRFVGVWAGVEWLCGVVCGFETRGGGEGEGNKEWEGEEESEGEVMM